MKKMIQSKFLLLLLLFVVFSVSLASFNSLDVEAEVPSAELPVLLTSAGQSADVTTLTILADNAGLKYDYCDVPTVEMIDAGVGLGGAKPGPETNYNYVKIKTNLDEYPEGTPYGTIIFSIGASLKGMGASGLSIKSEIARVKRILKYSNENEIFTIGVHIGGASKRGRPGSDNEKVIDAVAPRVDYLVVSASGNEDERFTDIAKDNEIPFTEIENATGLIDVLKQVFHLED